MKVVIGFKGTLSRVDMHIYLRTDKDGGRVRYSVNTERFGYGPNGLSPRVWSPPHNYGFLDKRTP